MQCTEGPTALVDGPGPGLAHRLADMHAAGLSEYELIEALRAAHRMAAWAASVELAVIADLDRRRMAQARARSGSVQRAAEFVVDEIAAALCTTGTAAAIRAAMALKLAGPLAATGRALAEGRIDFEKARTVCDAVTGLTHVDATAVQDEVLEQAERCTVGQLRPLLRKAIAKIAPDQEEKRAQEALDSRRLELWPNLDGTADLSGRSLPEDEAQAAFNRVSAIAAARKSDGDTRPLDQIRADVFLDLLRGHATTAALTIPARPTKSGEPKKSERPQAATPAADDPIREIAALVADKARGELAAALAGSPEGKRALLVAEAGERIRRALHDLVMPWCSSRDSDGHSGSAYCAPAFLRRLAIEEGARSHLYGHGSRAYRPPASLRRRVTERDSRCVFPTCRRPAAQADLDHTVPFHRGGPTAICNLAVLCRHHHQLKQQPGWRLIQIWPGVLLWVTPTGHWYLSTSADYGGVEGLAGARRR